MIRPESDIIELRDVLLGVTEKQAEELRSLADDGERFDDVAFAFNHNQQMLNVLEWVLGDDTKIAFGRGTGENVNRNPRMVKQ